jgi:hypothetical protein
VAGGVEEAERDAAIYPASDQHRHPQRRPVLRRAPCQVLLLHQNRILRSPCATAGGAEDESARNGCGGRRERTKGLGTTRDGRQISGRKVEATTCSMGAARVKVSAVASRVSQDWIGFLSCYCPGDGPPCAGLQAEGRGQRGGRAGICGVGGEAGSGRRRRRASSGSSSRSIILRKGKGNMVNLRC